jgi:hypothetical protein
MRRESKASLPIDDWPATEGNDRFLKACPTFSVAAIRVRGQGRGPAQILICHGLQLSRHTTAIRTDFWRHL